MVSSNGINDYRRILWGIIIALLFGAYVFSFSVLLVLNRRLVDLNTSIIRLYDKTQIRLDAVEKVTISNQFRIGHIREKLGIISPPLE